MLHTERTDKACDLLKSYARTLEQKIEVEQAYVDTLADNDNEDRVVINLLGFILDGLRYDNWLWNMPPSAQTVTCPEHGHPHTYGSSRSKSKGQY
jgi:hypothetical protein